MKVLLESWRKAHWESWSVPYDTGWQHFYNKRGSPSWYGSVGWVPACEPKGHQCNSQPGHMPGLWARSPIRGMWEATTHWRFSPSLSPSLPLSLKALVPGTGQHWGGMVLRRCPSNLPRNLLCSPPDICRVLLAQSTRKHLKAWHSEISWKSSNHFSMCWGGNLRRDRSKGNSREWQKQTWTFGPFEKESYSVGSKFLKRKWVSVRSQACTYTH